MSGLGSVINLSQAGHPDGVPWPNTMGTAAEQALALTLRLLGSKGIIRHLKQHDPALIEQAEEVLATWERECVRADRQRRENEAPA